MTAALFVQAVDALRHLGWALVVWIVLCAAVAALILHAVVTVVWWVSRGLWRAVRAVWARGRCQELAGAPGSPSRQPGGIRGVPEAAQARSERPAPSWADTQTTNETKEAA